MYRVTRAPDERFLVEVVSRGAHFSERRFHRDSLPRDLLLKIALLDLLGESGTVECLGTKLSGWQYELVETPHPTIVSEQ